MSSIKATLYKVPTEHICTYPCSFEKSPMTLKCKFVEEQTFLLVKNIILQMPPPKKISCSNSIFPCFKCNFTQVCSAGMVGRKQKNVEKALRSGIWTYLTYRCLSWWAATHVTDYRAWHDFKWWKNLSEYTGQDLHRSVQLSRKHTYTAVHLVVAAMESAGNAQTEALSVLLRAA